MKIRLVNYFQHLRLADVQQNYFSQYNFKVLVALLSSWHL